MDDTFVASFVEVDHSLAAKIRSAQLMGNPRNGVKDCAITRESTARGMEFARYSG